MKEFLAALVGSVAGGLFALVGSYLASRWQAEHHRSNLLHEARIALYVDIVSDCQRQSEDLDLLGESFGIWRVAQKNSNRYRPAVPIEARLELLALPRTRKARDGLMAAQQRLYGELKRESEDWPTSEDDFISAQMAETKEVRRRLAEVLRAARADLGVRG